MFHACWRALIVVCFVLVAHAPAHADLTAFIGASFSGDARDTVSGDGHTGTVKGVAVGLSLIIVGFEFEWATTGGDDIGEGTCLERADFAGLCAPSLTTAMGNVLLQTPRGLGPVQLYGTVGAGFYRERFAPFDRRETSVGTNVGGGVKIDVLGPLRVRVDYRVFKLGGDAVYATPQRLYVGANLAF